VNCDLWCLGLDSKDLGGRLEQDPGYTSRPWHQYGIWSAAGGAASGVHQLVQLVTVLNIGRVLKVKVRVSGVLYEEKSNQYRILNSAKEVLINY